MSAHGTGRPGAGSETPASGRVDAARHWDQRFRDAGPTEVSWYQPEPTMSLELIDELSLAPDDPIIDIGGGASLLVDSLVERGYRDLTVLDVSEQALSAARRRLGDRAADLTWVLADLRDWRPSRRYRLWHDRAVFHFLTEPAGQAHYRALAAEAVASGGHLIVGAFAADGPTHCSGLPVARYTPDQLAGAFMPAFLPVSSRRETHHTPGGAAQPFTWILLHRADPAAFMADSLVSADAARAAWTTVALRYDGSDPNSLAQAMAVPIREFGPALIARGAASLLGAITGFLTTHALQRPDQILADLATDLAGPDATVLSAGVPLALGVASATLLGQDPVRWLDQHGDTQTLEYDAVTEVLWLLARRLDNAFARPGFTHELVAPILAPAVGP